MAIITTSCHVMHCCRHVMYPYYKGKRQADPAPVTVAICLLAEALQHVGIMSLSPRGVEADDVIATLASRAVQQGMQVRARTQAGTSFLPAAAGWMPEDVCCSISCTAMRGQLLSAK